MPGLCMAAPNPGQQVMSVPVGGYFRRGVAAIGSCCWNAGGRGGSSGRDFLLFGTWSLVHSAAAADCTMETAESSAAMADAGAQVPGQAQVGEVRWHLFPFISLGVLSLMWLFKTCCCLLWGNSFH